jgi:hypothetical protein
MNINTPTFLTRVRPELFDHSEMARLQRRLAWRENNESAINRKQKTGNHRNGNDEHQY